jgi:hypothetical protein
MGVLLGIIDMITLRSSSANSFNRAVPNKKNMET